MSLNKNEKIGVFVALVLALIFIFFSADLFRGEDSDATDSDLNVVLDSANNNGNDDSRGLIMEDVAVGDGAVATLGSLVTAHYVGTLTDGTKFDSSVDRGEPFQFLLGTGQVIKGWDQGILGMKVGGVRRLVIPPELGYGSKQAGPIPPDSTLVFEVQLLGVESPQ